MHGATELVHAGELIADALRDDMAPAHLEVATQIIPAATALVPVLTGALGGSLRAETSRTRAWVTSDLPYAGVQEWGWPDHNIDGSHFLVDGARNAETQWLDTYTDAVQGHINDGVHRAGADNPPTII